MTSLTRFNPFQEMFRLTEAMDRLFENSWPATVPVWSRLLVVPMDLVETDDEFVLWVSVPGINPDELDISYNDRLLTIKGEIVEGPELKNARYHLRERQFGSFSRSITLPTAIDEDKIQATFENGVLVLHLPKSEEAKPKRITVRSGDGRKVIEG